MIRYVVALTFALGIVRVAKADSAAAVTAYHQLASADLEAKRIPQLPAEVDAWPRVDVSQKARSASFGHATTLIVSPSADTFYVEYGRSTNRPRRYFGPFAVR
jgi:hypothetical protein